MSRATAIFTPKYKQNVFNALWFGEMISIIGSGLTGFALRVWAYEQTASVTQFALITFFYGLPGVLISPVAGVWVDRWDRRKTMLFSDLGAALSTLGVLLLVNADLLQTWHIYIAVAIISLFGAIQEPASQATVALLVPKEKLGRANGMMQIGPAASRIVAPFLAGLLLVTIGLKGIAQIDLATFMFAAIVLLGIRIPNPARENIAEETAVAPKKTSYIEDAKMGWQYIRERLGFYYLLLLSVVINFTQGMVVVLIAPIVLSFADAKTLGWVFAVSGVGALLGAITMSVWGGPKRKMNGFIIFGFLRAILLLLGGLQPNPLLIALASAFYLFFSQIANASLITIWQKKVPTQIQGRVFATVRIAATLFFPLGQILAGPLSDYVFQPLLEVNGVLASSVGQIIGVGSGRGIGFLLIVTGFINLIIMVFVFAHPRTRLIEDEIPDAIPDEAQETDAAVDTAVSTTQTQKTTNLQSRGENMKSGKKWGLRIGLALVALVIVLASYIYISLRRALPQTDGTLALPGLNEEVRVVRDEWGTVQIYAENEHDLFFAQGFATAQDRMFQMEVFRRSPSGRMAEIVGSQAVFIDTFNRNMLMRETAELIWEEMDPDSKEILQAYTDGINAYLEENKNALPVEYKILRFKPEPWTPIDSLVWGNAISLQLSGNRRLELIRMQVFAAVGEEGMNLLYPYSAEDTPITVPEDTAAAFAGFDKVDLTALLQADAVYGTPLDGIGSNGWVVDGSMTESGMPIVANDIHIGLTMPSIWHAVGLHGGRFDVVGFTLPGVPGIITGHNADIGWSITNLGSDAQDFYIERLDDTVQPTQYQYDGEWLDLEHIQQTIEVRGGAPVTVDFYVTPHGPIMNYVLENPSFGHPLALRWVQQEGSTLFTSILKLNMASNWDEFQDALAGWDTPGQNIFYADREGNIGYQAVGKIPIRPNGNGRLPVPGWTSENEWEGYIPYEELPSAYNPEQGFLLSTNNRVEPEGYPYYISDSYTPGYRAQQIEYLLKEYAPLSVADMDLIQEDTYSPQAVQIMPYLDVIQANTPLEEAALDALLNWNLQTDIEGAGTSVYEAWQQRFLADIITDELGPETANLYISGHYVRHATQQMPMLIDMLAEPNHPWFDNKNTPEVETRDDIIQQAFTEAVVQLTQLQGDDIANWDWGRLHSVTFPHQPFNQVAVLKNIFNSDTYPMRGGNFSVYTNSYDWANPFKVWIVSSARHITDLNDFSNSVMLGSTGQNMNLLSPHREDVVKLWQEGSPFPMSFTEAEVEAVQESTLVLQPGN